MENWKNKLRLDDDELISSYHSDFFDSEIKIRFMGTSEKLGTNQTEIVDRLLEDEENLFDNSIQKIIDFYKESYPHYRLGMKMAGADDEFIERILPNMIDKEKLLNLITPTYIYIDPEDDCKDERFGLGFECEWDIEHGLGISFKNWKVEYVGGMDVAFEY